MLLKGIYYNLITNILTPEIKWEYAYISKEIEKNIKNLERVICVYQENTSFIVNIY
jgi:phospholipase C